jgi:glycosyltransferase involved in cell wall biosynthesis
MGTVRILTMKILFLTRYSRLGASSRLRTYQYLPLLEVEGFTVEAVPFFDDEYLRDLYSGKRQPRQLIGYYARRFAKLLSANKADLIWIEKEALPWVPWWLEHLMLPSGVRYVVDYDDAVFHRYDLDSKGIVRHLLHDKIDRVMQNAACVMVGNDYLGERAFNAGAPRIETVPTVVDLDRYKIMPDRHDRDRPRVGWIGTPKTWQGSARPTYINLRRTIAACEATFRAIGSSLDPVSEQGFENIPWTEHDEVSLIQSLDVGIMPLQNDPWTRGKCAYKLVQYMACGVAVVASPVGLNTQIVQHGVNGFLADTEQEWRECVARLLSDPQLREDMGAAGRRQIEERYSLHVWAPKVADILRSLR